MGYPSGEAFMKQDAATIAGMKANVWVLIVTYFFLTVAELFSSSKPQLLTETDRGRSAKAEHPLFLLSVQQQILEARHSADQQL